VTQTIFNFLRTDKILTQGTYRFSTEWQTRMTNTYSVTFKMSSEKRKHCTNFTTKRTFWRIKKAKTIFLIFYKLLEKVTRWRTINLRCDALTRFWDCDSKKKICVTNFTKIKNLTTIEKVHDFREHTIYIVRSPSACRHEPLRGIDSFSPTTTQNFKQLLRLYVGTPQSSFLLLGKRQKQHAPTNNEMRIRDNMSFSSIINEIVETFLGRLRLLLQTV